MKWYVLVCLFVGGAYYVVDLGSGKDPIKDVVNYSLQHHHPVYTQKVRYYASWAYLQRSEWDRAQHAYTEFLIDYPTGQYMEASLMGLAISAEENRSWELAKAAIKRHIDEFPKSKSRDVALKKMEMLKYHHGADIGVLPTKEEYYPSQNP